MSSVERSNSEYERDSPSNPETSSNLEASNANRSSISDKPIQEQITSKEHESLTGAIAENSSQKKSDFDNKSEWENLLGKLRGWIGPQIFANQSDFFVDPSLLIIGLASLLIVIKAYTNILSSLEKIPLAPGLCELAGAAWLTHFSITHLLRKKDRQSLIFKMKSQWKSFLGVPAKEA